MADKQITVAVPEDRVPEFYAWFAAFLAADHAQGGSGLEPFGPGGLGRGRGRGMRADHGDTQPWSADDAAQAQWLLGKLAPPARTLFDLLAAHPGERFGGNDVAARLGLDKGAHGVAGVLAWPGRYSRKLDRDLPILTEGRSDGGTVYYMEPGVAALFASSPPARRMMGAP
jgi:hypothetical protein